MSPVPGTTCPRAASSRRSSLEVVQLAVEDRDDVAGLVQRRLVAGLEVDDLEATMAEDATPERRDAAGVRTSMDERFGHARDDVRVGRSGGRY